MNIKLKYCCIYCESGFQGYSQYVFHMNKYGTEKSDRFKCPFCDSTLSSGKVLSKHLRAHEFKGEKLIHLFGIFCLTKSVPRISIDLQPSYFTKYECYVLEALRVFNSYVENCSKSIKSNQLSSLIRRKMLLFFELFPFILNILHCWAKQYSQVGKYVFIIYFQPKICEF